MKPLGLYIHIPFCVKKCDYCDFLSFGCVPQRTKDMYIECLCNEIRDYGALFQGKYLSTVYIGGGTPSVLTVENFNKVMGAVKAAFKLKDDAEVTMEMNPGTVTEEKLGAYLAAGINRVSMGLQSDDDGQLKDLGRIHTFEDYKRTYTMVREKGISNINVDVMFGLHDQTMEQWQHTLESVIQLNPEHISAYSLIIEEETPFEDRYEAGQLNLPDEDLERAMFWYTHDRLAEAGYKHYEISNYSKEGLESRHNSSYWDLTPYIGVGLGASSFYNQKRYKNVTSINDYLVEEGRIDRIRLLEQANDDQVNLEETFFLGLRRMKGVDLKRIEEVYGIEALRQYNEVIEEEIGKGLLVMDGQHLRLTKRGIDISNQVMSRFLL